jgi:hypothetical protein
MDLQAMITGNCAGSLHGALHGTGIYSPERHVLHDQSQLLNLYFARLTQFRIASAALDDPLFIPDGLAVPYKIESDGFPPWILSSADGLLYG